MVITSEQYREGSLPEVYQLGHAFRLDRKKWKKQVFMAENTDRMTTAVSKEITVPSVGKLCAFLRSGKSMPTHVDFLLVTPRSRDVDLEELQIQVRMGDDLVFFKPQMYDKPIVAKDGITEYKAVLFYELSENNQNLERLGWTDMTLADVEQMEFTLMRC